MKNYIRLKKKYEDRVRDIYNDLFNPTLVQRCLRGESQNKQKPSFQALASPQQSQVCWNEKNKICNPANSDRT